MHNLEPYYNWLHLYNATNDVNSPFYGKENSEFYYSDRVYDHLIHPQWDNFGSNTLYLKILYVDYFENFAVIEMIGEWNDCIESDIMTFLHEIIEPFQIEGIDKFILIGENVLNFFGSDDEYYAEWNENNEEGWVALVNFNNHVTQEMSEYNIDHFWMWGGELDDMDWRKLEPTALFDKVSSILTHRISL